MDADAATGAGSLFSCFSVAAITTIAGAAEAASASAETAAATASSGSYCCLAFAAMATDSAKADRRGGFQGCPVLDWPVSPAFAVASGIKLIYDA